MKRLAKLSIVMGATVLMVAFLVQPAMADPTISVRIGLPVVVELQSSPQPVWVEGCHHWDGDDYVWIPGHWERMTRPRVIYVPASYSHVVLEPLPYRHVLREPIPWNNYHPQHSDWHRGEVHWHYRK
jgi:hypothetical protein